MKSHWFRTRLSTVSFVLLLRRAPVAQLCILPSCLVTSLAALESLSLVSLKVLSLLRRLSKVTILYFFLKVGCCLETRSLCTGLAGLEVTV